MTNSFLYENGCVKYFRRCFLINIPKAYDLTSAYLANIEQYEQDTKYQLFSDTNEFLQVLESQVIHRLRSMLAHTLSVLEPTSKLRLILLKGERSINVLSYIFLKCLLSISKRKQ